MNDQQTRATQGAEGRTQRYEESQQSKLPEIAMTAMLIGMTVLLAWLWSM